MNPSQVERPRSHLTTWMLSYPPKAPVSSFVLYIRPVLSSSKALGLTARSLHQCCRAQCSHTMNHMPREENLDLWLDLVHGSAVGTATPKQPKINLLHI